MSDAIMMSLIESTGTGEAVDLEDSALAGPSLGDHTLQKLKSDCEKEYDNTRIDADKTRPSNTSGQNAGLIEQGVHATESRQSQGTGGAVDERKKVYAKAVGGNYLDRIKRQKFEKKSKNKLFVGGLVLDVNEEFLQEIFKKYGEIVDVCIVYEKGSHVSRGFGYVTFSTEKDAEEAIKGVDGMRVNGKTLCVEFADDPKFTRPPRRRSRSRSPRRYQGPRHSPPRDRNHERDRRYDRGPYFERDRCARDRYEAERYPRNDPYDDSPSNYYHAPPPPPDYYDYRRLPPRGPPPVTEYKDRFGRDIPPPEERPSRISDVDHARLRVNRERVRMPDRAENTVRSRDYRYFTTDKSYGKDGYSDSNSSDDDDDPKTKPRQVSAFPSAYLS